MTRKDIDVIVVQSGSRNHKSVRMERCSSDRSRAVAQEARVGLEVRYWLSVVDVIDLDTMLLSSTAALLARHL